MTPKLAIIATHPIQYHAPWFARLARGPLNVRVFYLWDSGVAEHGASVHYVTPDLEGGPVIAQVRVAVLPGDDAESLARRVLAREHPLLVETLALFAAGRISLRDDRVQLDGVPLSTPLQLAANQRFA